MRISTVEAVVDEISVQLPLLETTEMTPVVFARVETEDGTVGYGETGYLHPAATAAFIDREIAGEIVGMNPLETGRIWDTLFRELNPRSQTGVWSTAVSAVDIALWDIKGKRFEEPVWRLLGGSRSVVPTYVTFGFAAYDVEQLQTQAESLVAEGHDGLKMVVGATESATPRSDAERIRAVRSAVGEEVDLMIDANYRYSLEESLELCNRIEDLHITWFEEPVAGNDVHLLSSLRERTRIPIAAGQNEGHLFRHRELIDGGVDICQPNVCFVGGFTEAVRVAALARAHNLRIANGGGWPFQNLHLQGGVSNGSRVEYHVPVWEADKEMYASLPEPEAGVVSLPEAPGIGLEPTDRLRAAFAG